MVFQRLNITPSALPMISILSSIKNVRTNGLDLSPDYQRGYIWSNEYKDQLILSIILNYPIGNIVINNLERPNPRNARQELVDGKQRLTTILRFTECGAVSQWVDDNNDNWFQLSRKNSEQAKEIIDGIVGKSDPEGLARMHRARRLSFKDLPASIQMNFNAYSIPVYTMQAADPAQIRDYFKVLQNQEKLRAGEIINALPSNPLSKYFDTLPDEAFMEKLGCRFKRAELEKVYCSMLGMWFDKIQLNSSDKNVIEFVDNLESISESEQQAIHNLDEGVIAVSRLQSPVAHGRTSKRTLKILFGLALHVPGYFSGDDVLSKVEQITELSAKLAAFNSSESDAVSFSKYFGDEFKMNESEFLNSRAPVYRLIFSATTRSIAKVAFTQAMEITRRLFSESFESALEYYTAIVKA